jgi:hypothetical protein
MPPLGSCTLTLTSGFPLFAKATHSAPSTNIAATLTTTGS